MLPNLRPSLDDLRAVVTTRWGGKGYRPTPVRKIETYYVDTALDNDADTWVLTLGDPTYDYAAFADRDNEIRVKLFGVGSEGSSDILTGIADDATFDDGTWTLTGRDFSSLATDSTLPPSHFRHVRAYSLVEQQAKKLGFRNTRLAHGKMVRKIQFTDGSESYWDFWWRLYRKEQMWLWCEPDGTLVANTLNYSSHVDYYLGDPRSSDSNSIKVAHIPVIGYPSIAKTTQHRVGEVHVWWHKGDNGARTIVKDPTISQWQKKPIKVMLDTDAHSEKAAKKTALEEIFEGKVGSVELKVTIPDPGFPIRQNRIARLNLPSLGISGQYFVVGARMQAGPEGFIQEIRLREKQYAVTRRIPTDPKPAKSTTPGTGAASGLGASIEGNVSGMHTGWGDYFAKAARAWHGPWDYSLFLATLIGIGKQETGFQNERQHGGPGGDVPEWYPFKTPAPADTSTIVGSVGHAFQKATETRTQWETKFANEAGDGYISWEAGVGPMQLTDRGLKHEADDRLRANFRNEFSGGRWHAEHNIWVAAKYLRSCLQATVGDSGRDIDMWIAVDAYNRGVAGAKAFFNANGHPSSYALAVKNYVYNDPGYLSNVKSSIEEATSIANQPADGAGFAAAAGEGGKNSLSDISSLTHIRLANSSVDVAHVDWPLLVGFNNCCRSLGTIGIVTSGFRTYAQQKALWDRYANSGFQQKYIAARPGTSNHERGKAIDVEVFDRPGFYTVPAVIAKANGVQFPLGANDAVHMTRIGVNG